MIEIIAAWKPHSTDEQRHLEWAQHISQALPKPLHEQSIEDFDTLMAINTRGLFLCMKYEIQQMLTQGSGASTYLCSKAIVNTSSLGGLIAFPGASPYVASKHAVMGLTRAAALDYAKQDSD